MKLNIKNKILIIIGVLSIFIATTHAYTSKTYEKSDQDEFISPIGGGFFMLQDGSKLFRFYRPLNDGMCNEPDLHLKILHVNGTLLPFTINDLSIPKFNFCRLNQSPLSADYVQVTSLRRETSNFYIIYYNISDTDFTLPFGRIIAQVDLEGKILSENWLGYANYYNGSIIGRLGKFKYIYDSYYYIKLVDISNPNLLSWQKFGLTPIDGLLYKKDESGIVSREHLSLQYDNPLFSFETIDNGLGFIYSKNYSQINANTALEPSLYVYVNFFKPDVNMFTDPFIIYQTSSPNVIMRTAMCAADTMGIGYQCILQLRKISSVELNSVYGSNMVLLVSFLSSGSVTGIKQLSGNFESANLVIRHPLTFGGYLLMYFKDIQTGRLIDGEIFDTNDIYNSPWDIPENFVIPFPYVIIYNFIEKKFEIISSITQKDFTIISSDVPRFINADVSALTMAAAKITSIDPPNDATILLGTNTLKINYEVPVSLSTRNITIYQIDGKNIRMRQTTSGQISEFCSIIDPDNKIVSLNVLPSTFNVPNSEYHVYISSNFVRHNNSNEPINNFPHTGWVLHTEGGKEEPYADSFSGSIRLTPEGTTIHKSNPKDFTDQLLQEISLILPVDLDRLISEGPTQIDTSTPFEQLIIPLKVKSIRDPSKRNADNLHNDLNTMITNKGFTEIFLHPHTSLLDETYGYKLKVDIKDVFLENKESLVAAMIILLLLVVTFLWAKRKNGEGNNIVIFKIGLSIVDFVFDALFIYKNGNDIRILFLPSLAIFIFSTLFNLIAAFSLVIYENSLKDEFNEWFKSNSVIASIFTLLSATNIEVMNTLTSQFAGLDMFSVNFSKKTESRIFWFSILNFIVEDIPQFGIQVFYKTRVVSYGIIPFLSLITSGLMIVFNFIGRLYNSIIQYQKDRSNNYRNSGRSSGSNYNLKKSF